MTPPPPEPPPLEPPPLPPPPLGEPPPPLGDPPLEPPPLLGAGVAEGVLGSSLPGVEGAGVGTLDLPGQKWGATLSKSVPRWQLSSAIGLPMAAFLMAFRSGNSLLSDWSDDTSQIMRP